MWYFDSMRFALPIVSMLAAGCAASPPPAQSPITPTVQSRTHEVESQPKGQPAAAEARLPAEVRIVGDGGSFVDTLDTRSGIRGEGFFLGGGGQYVWIESALKSMRPSPENEGPGYLRRGTWDVEGEALVLHEHAQVVFVDGSDVKETVSLTRTLRIGRCEDPKDSCVTLDGANFYPDHQIDADEEGAGLWPDDR